jgi:hypothetical protein
MHLRVLSCALRCHRTIVRWCYDLRLTVHAIDEDAELLAACHRNCYLWLFMRIPPEGAHLLPLPAALCELLTQFPAVPGNPYVFVGRGPKGHLVNARCYPFRPHTHHNIHGHS